ncbi:MAG: hypothetical protein KQI35_10605 [Bacteroidetes bacterium]|nr:hypothetical protein [Bacteroidota bacterium]
MHIQLPDILKIFSNHVLLGLLIIAGIQSTALAQVDIDSTQTEVAVRKKIPVDTSFYQEHSARRATLYSMVLPGLGQAYNKKYWKIPIIYGGFTVFYFLIQYNDTEYQLFKEAYYHKLTNEDGSEDPVNEYEEKYDEQTLLNAKNDYRRNRDLNYILSGVWYVLNIIDAAVDAHLFSWEVDDDLSLRVEPDLYTPNMLGLRTGGGVKLTLRF